MIHADLLVVVAAFQLLSPAAVSFSTPSVFLLSASSSKSRFRNISDLLVSPPTKETNPFPRTVAESTVLIPTTTTLHHSSSSMANDDLGDDALLDQILAVAIDASKKAGDIIVGNAGGAEVTERKANSRDLLTLIDPLCEKVSFGYQQIVCLSACVSVEWVVTVFLWVTITSGRRTKN